MYSPQTCTLPRRAPGLDSPHLDADGPPPTVGVITPRLDPPVGIITPRLDPPWASSPLAWTPPTHTMSFLGIWGLPLRCHLS